MNHISYNPDALFQSDSESRKFPPGSYECLQNDQNFNGTNEKKEQKQKSHQEAVSEFHGRHSKKNNWSEEEDQTLKRIILESGARNWAYISAQVGTRTGKQCRERWHNHLRDGVNKGEWSLHQYWILALCVRCFGRKWSTISKYLPGRTDNTIKNQWNCKMKQLIGQFDDKIEKIKENSTLKKKLSKTELYLINQIQNQDESAGKLTSKDRRQIKRMKDALDLFRRTEEEVNEEKNDVKDEGEFQRIALDWEEKAIEGGQNLFNNCFENSFF